MTDVRTFIEVVPGMKARLRTAIEALVDVLDSLEPDVDIEENGDDELTGDEEPLLGATIGMHQGHAWNVPSDEADEAEPSLGWVGVGQGFHGLALPGYADDREEENEHGGDVLDEPHDAEAEGDTEPWLGSLEWEGRNGDQTRWGCGDTTDREAGDDNGIADSGGLNEQMSIHVGGC